MKTIRLSANRKRPRRRLTLAGAMLAILVGVAGAQAVSPADHIHQHHHWYEFGMASWYGRFFQGKTTASGEPYNENALTCAQRQLPLGSLIRVTNLRNQKSVIVRVNDRGPVPHDRVIDLSRAAAQRLGFSQQGLAPVKIELLRPGSDNPQEIAALRQPPLGH